MSIRIDSVLNNRYRITDEIGRGGMSIIYLAKDLNMNKQWAIKEIRRTGDQKKDNAYRKAIEKEKDMLSRIDDHPAMPRITEIFYYEDSICIVMDYIEGENLSKILKANGPLPQEDVIYWAKQVCAALIHLQSKEPPIIYRDLKPSNLMLKPDGQIKLIDFGTAIEYYPGEQQNKACTPHYAAPEQRAKTPYADFRSDIYCLGATMFQLLTGELPNSVDMQKNGIRQYNALLYVGLENIIKKCVAPDPANRYQNAAELMYALEHYDEEDELFKKKQKKKLNLFLASTSLAVVMAIIGTSMMIASSSTKKHEYYDLIANNTVESCAEALTIDRVKYDAYEALLNIYENSAEAVGTKDLDVAASALRGGESEMKKDKQYVDLCYSLGSLYFYSDLNTDIPTRLKDASIWFERVVKTVDEENIEYENYEMAKNFCALHDFCSTFLSDNGINEAKKSNYEDLLNSMNACLKNLKKLDANDAKYMQITTCDAICYLVTSQKETMADFGIDKQQLINLINNAADFAQGVTGITKQQTKQLQADIAAKRNDYIGQIENTYANTAIRTYLNGGEGELS